MKEIIRKYDLNTGQVQRQLANWKKRKFHHGKIICKLNADEIKSVIESHLSWEETDSMVYKVLESMVPGSKENLALDSYKVECYDSFCHHEGGKGVIEAMLLELAMIQFFVKVVKNFVSIASDCFPKMASMLPKAEKHSFWNTPTPLTICLPQSFLLLQKNFCRALSSTGEQLSYTLKMCCFGRGVRFITSQACYP